MTTNECVFAMLDPAGRRRNPSTRYPSQGWVHGVETRERYRQGKTLQGDKDNQDLRVKERELDNRQKIWYNITKRKEQQMSRKAKEFKVTVTESYSKTYYIEARDAEEAQEKADELASDDMELACPENMDDREFEVEVDED